MNNVCDIFAKKKEKEKQVSFVNDVSMYVHNYELVCFANSEFSCIIKKEKNVRRQCVFKT
jgi:hypothetical protein